MFNKYLLLWSVIALLIPVAAAFTSVIRRSSNYDDHPRGIMIRHAADAAADINDDNNSDAPAKHHQRIIVVLCNNVSQDVADGIFDVNNLPKGRIDVLARCVTSALWVSNRIRTDTTLFLMLSPHNITIELQGSRVRSLTPDERTVALYLQRTLWNNRKDNSMSAGSGSDSSFASSTSQTPPHSTYINPQSAPMSEEKRLRDNQKGREAMIHRIRISHQGKSSLPGFILHQNDSLQTRLNKLVSLSSGDDDDDDIWMLSETGDPLWTVLEDQQQKQFEYATKINTGQNRTTTLILGNQLGYSADDERLLLGTPAVREVSLGSLSLLTSQCITITHHYLDRLFEVSESEAPIYE
jgi:tRNA pseudouridine-54 N-methylase